MDYNTAKKKVERLRTQVDKAQGAIEELYGQLKEGFDCDDIDQAKEYLAQLKEEVAEKNERLESLLSAFENKWKNVLEDV